jgi:hypothetical protein
MAKKTKPKSAKRRQKTRKKSHSFMTLDENDLRELAPAKGKGPYKDQTRIERITTPRTD